MTPEQRRLLPSQRRQLIAELVERSGALRIGELANQFRVTDETIRRDLAALEEEGRVTREHGGAISVATRFETPFQRRTREHTEEKEAIARAAARLVEDGTTIIVDSGTTMKALVDVLSAKRDLVVITNGISHVPALLANPSTTVVITGGAIRRNSLGTVGDLAVATLETLHADHAFLATQGFSAQAGVTYPSFEEVAIKRAMINAGGEVTLLADGSKCGRTSMIRVAPMERFDRLITSVPVSVDEVSRIRELGVEVTVVDTENHAREESAA